MVKRLDDQRHKWEKLPYSGNPRRPTQYDKDGAFIDSKPICTQRLAWLKEKLVNPLTVSVASIQEFPPPFAIKQCLGKTRGRQVDSCGRVEYKENQVPPSEVFCQRDCSQFAALPVTKADHQTGGPLPPATQGLHRPPPCSCGSR